MKPEDLKARGNRSAREYQRRRRAKLTLEEKAKDYAIQLKWKREHPDRTKEHNRRSYQKHIVKRKAYNEAYRLLHPEQVKESDLRYRRSPKRKAYGARYLRLFRKRDPERFKIYESRRGPQRAKSRRIRYRNNRASIIDMVNRRRAKTSTIETVECSKKISVLHTSRFCHWCCKPLDTKNLTIDHVVALQNGGFHIPDNLVSACRSCNSSKGVKLVEDWTWITYEEAA